MSLSHCREVIARKLEYSRVVLFAHGEELECDKNSHQPLYHYVKHNVLIICQGYKLHHLVGAPASWPPRPGWEMGLSAGGGIVTALLSRDGE